MNTDKSTPIAIKYFQELGYKTFIVKRGKGFDFYILKDGIKTTVEAKGSAHFILPKQIECLKCGGLLAVVDKDKVKVLRYEDIEISNPALFYFSIKGDIK